MMFRKSIYLVLSVLAGLLCFVIEEATGIERDDNIDPRIIGGTDAISGGFYGYAQVSLQIKDRGDDHQCGGSLVAKDMIVSSAHCDGGFDQIEINRYNFRDRSENTIKLRRFQTWIHPQYDENRFDVMLIQLLFDDDDDDEIEILEDIIQNEQQNSMIRLNDDPTIPTNNQDLTVVGWGVTDVEADEYASVLQEVNVKYIPNLICQNIPDIDGFVLGPWLTSDMICAGDDGRDACYGDSGSPLIAFTDQQQQHVLVGIVSWGLECAGPIPGVYTRISRSYSWLQGIICRHSNFDTPEYLKCNTDSPTTVPTYSPANAPTNKPTASPMMQIDMTTIPPVSFSQVSNSQDITDEDDVGTDIDDNTNGNIDSRNCTYTTLMITGEEIDVGYHLIIESVEDNGLFLVQGVTGNFELYRGTPTRPTKRVWESGFYQGITDSTYVTTLNGHGNLITSRIDSNTGNRISVWNNGIDPTNGNIIYTSRRSNRNNNEGDRSNDNDSEKHVFALEECDDKENVVVIYQQQGGGGGGENADDGNSAYGNNDPTIDVSKGSSSRCISATWMTLVTTTATLLVIASISLPFPVLY